MQRRAGFTLIEVMVAMALTIFIMVILAQAFVAGLESFRQLKGLGDMQQGLRTAMTRLQADLRADHFEGDRRLSDPFFWNAGPPRMGFFHIEMPGVIAEGSDPDGLPSSRAVSQVLHFSIRLRGNHRESFLLATVPNGSPLLTGSTTLGGIPWPAGGLSPLPDARFQDGNLTYNSAWGEVAYFLARQGSTGEPNNPNSTLGTPLFALYRVQKVVVADTSAINGQVPAGQAASYTEMSCEANGNNLVFNSPVDLANGQRSLGSPYAPGPGASPLLNNVVSFQVQMLTSPGGNNPAIFDTSVAPGFVVVGLQITLRVWDPATEQARQVTLFQDM
jgi:prepilin-type N-terminal cleavage/methylation domain-containing protein